MLCEYNDTLGEDVTGNVNDLSLFACFRLYSRDSYFGFFFLFLVGNLKGTTFVSVLLSIEKVQNIKILGIRLET